MIVKEGFIAFPAIACMKEDCIDSKTVLLFNATPICY